MSDKKLVLVTGVTGFIAGHVANQYLDAGYRVRGTTRGSKAKTLSESIKLPGLEFVQVDDLATGDLTEALRGVHAVIHVASPLPGRTDTDDTLNSAIDGTLNVLRQIVKAGVEKVVITSSFGALLDPSLRPGFSGKTFTNKDWGVVTREEVRAKADDPYYVYFASKVLSEKAIWEFAKEHPQLDIATILPGFVFGPFADHYPVPASPKELGTNGMIYGIMKSTPLQPPPWVVDVRDVAKAHVLALNVPRKPLEEKRYIVNGGNLSWREAVAHLNKTHPDLKTAAVGDYPDLPGPAGFLDTSVTVKDLNFGEFIHPTAVIDATVDTLLALEKKTWAA